MIDKQLIQNYATKYNYTTEDVEKVIYNLTNGDLKFFDSKSVENMIESGLKLVMSSGK